MCALGADLRTFSADGGALKLIAALIAQAVRFDFLGGEPVVLPDVENSIRMLLFLPRLQQGAMFEIHEVKEHHDPHAHPLEQEDDDVGHLFGKHASNERLCAQIILIDVESENVREGEED